MSDKDLSADEIPEDKISSEDDINTPADNATDVESTDGESSIRSDGRTESTVAQGTKFELKVTELLEAYGYKVQHNVVVNGKSGAPHQIDVVAEHRGPLHSDFLVVEAKAYSKGHNIVKDVLMKQLNICSDIGYGGIMIFATSHFASGCHTTAKQYKHVTLIDGDSFASLLRNAGLDADGMVDKKTHKPVYIKPHITKSKAKKYAKSRAKKRSGGIFKKLPKVFVKSVTLVCYPYYTVKYHHEKMEKKGMFRKIEIMRKIPHEASVDARIGIVMNVEKHGLSYALKFIKDLKPDEIRLLKHANKKKMITPVETKASGVSKEVAASCMPRLHSLGYVSRLSMSDASWKINQRIPRFVKSLSNVYSKHMQEIPPGIPVPSTLPFGNAIQAVSWLGDKVDGVTLTHYPFYDIRYEDSQETVYNEMLDAVTGKEVTEIAETMSEWKPRIGDKERFENAVLEGNNKNDEDSNKNADKDDDKNKDDEDGNKNETQSNVKDDYADIYAADDVVDKSTSNDDEPVDYTNTANRDDYNSDNTNMSENNTIGSNDNSDNDTSKNDADNRTVIENNNNKAGSTTNIDDEPTCNESHKRVNDAETPAVNQNDDRTNDVKQTENEHVVTPDSNADSHNSDEQTSVYFEDSEFPLDVKWSMCTKLKKSRFG